MATASASETRARSSRSAAPQAAEETQLHDALHRPVHRSGREEELARPALPDPGNHRQVVRGDILDAQQPSLLAALADQAFAAAEAHGLGARWRGVGRDSPQHTAGIRDVHRAYLRIEVLGEKTQQPFPEPGEAMLTAEPVGESYLSGANPRLGGKLPIVPRGHERGGEDEGYQNQRPASRHDHGLARGRVPSGLAVAEDSARLGLHGGNESGGAKHGLPAPIGAHDRERGSRIARPSQRHGLLELRHFGARIPRQLVELLLLPGIVGGQPPKTLELARDRGPRALVGLKIVFVAGEQESALAGLGVAHRQVQCLQLLDLIETVLDELRRRRAGAQLPRREQGYEDERQKRNQKAGGNACRKWQRGKTATKIPPSDCSA